MSFPKIVHQKSSFGPLRKNPSFRFCRPILDIFGLPLLKLYYYENRIFSIEAILTSSLYEKKNAVYYFQISHFFQTYSSC